MKFHKGVKLGSQTCWEPISKHHPEEPVGGFCWRLLSFVLEGCKLNVEIESWYVQESTSTVYVWILSKDLLLTWTRNHWRKLLGKWSVAHDDKGLGLVTMEVSPLLHFLRIFPCLFSTWSKQLRARKKGGSGSFPATAKSFEDSFSCSWGLLTITAIDCSSQGPLRLCWVLD